MLKITEKYKERIRDEFSNLPKDKKWNFLYGLISTNLYNYRDIARILGIKIDSAIRIFQKLDLKKCCKGKNCLNSNGPVQSRSNFYNNKNMQDGLDGQCICCQKQYRQENKEYYRQLIYQHRQENKEHCRQLIRQHYYNNREYYKQHHKQYWQNNRKHLNQKAKKYRNSYAKFDTFNKRIGCFEEIRRDPNNLETLQVRCTYCNRWFNPINQQIQDRIAALERESVLPGSENRFYCSNECKQTCPIYNQTLYLKDDPNYNHVGTSREVQSELRQLVFKRDNWTCQRCGKYISQLSSGVTLHCHHIEGIRHEPLESADTDMCLTVCSECHKEIHQIPGCTYQDFQCKN